jgi:macrolide transport system ATP-binding/permease protein
MIELKDITKSYQMGEHTVRALNGISLTIEDGDFVAIMGPSGSGKSTLTHILGLLDVPGSGSYKLHGREVSSLTEDELAVARREEIGFIFQQFNLLPRMSALDNVALPLLYSHKKMTTDFAQELLERVHLGPRAHHRPNELSGGQQQRVAIARSLINRPRIVFADEPTGNLDSQSEKEIMGILKELNNQGITVIIVTHEEDIGLQAKRLIRLRDGKIQSDTRQSPLKAEQEPAPRPVFPESTFSITDLFAHFVIGFKTLAANKIRTGLSMLGILIGVAAVVAMLAIGRGAQMSIEKELSTLGSNLLVLRAGGMRIGGVAQQAGGAARLTNEDALYIKDKIPAIKDVATRVSGRGQVTHLNKNWSTEVTGVAPSYATMRNSDAEQGRFFTDEENVSRARVAVVGMTIVRELFGDEPALGGMIKINKVNFQIIGILTEKGSNGWQDQDDQILIPVNTAMRRLFGKNYVDAIDIEVAEADKVSDTEDAVLDLILARKRVPLSQKDDAYQVRNMADIQQAISQSNQTMSILLAAIAAISLLVGGIGIMNIMLVSVTERTKEIGLRKAIGARRSDILLQFLAESIVVSVVGGALGILLGATITFTLSMLTGWTTSVSIESVLLSFFFSAIIGIVFGSYPASKASKLNPIDALRYE